MFPILRGRHALDPLEGGTKDTLAGEADILHGQGGIFQQIPGSVHAGVENVLMRCEPSLLFEGADEMIAAQPGKRCQLFYGQFFRKMFTDIGGYRLRQIHAGI